MAWTPTLPTWRLFHFCLFSHGSYYPVPHPAPVCLKYAFVSASPDSLRPPCPLVDGKSLKVLPRASSCKPEKQRQTLRLPDHTAPFPLAQETWFQLGVPVFTQMLARGQWKIRWIWNLKPVNLTISVVKL